MSSITLPYTVTEICSYTFYNCKQLREVIFNEGLQKIGPYAFHNCISLSSITFPSTITEIGSYAFYSCRSLREVVLHGVLPREIGIAAFHNCTPLERFTFPTKSSRLDTLIQTGHWDEINNRVDTARGAAERSVGELFVSTQTMTGVEIETELEKVLTRSFD